MKFKAAMLTIAMLFGVAEAGVGMIGAAPAEAGRWDRGPDWDRGPGRDRGAGWDRGPGWDRRRGPPPREWRAGHRRDRHWDRGRRGPDRHWDRGRRGWR